MGDRDELDVERADLDDLAVDDGDHLGATEQPGFLDAVAGEAERQRAAVDRQRPIEQMADPVVVAQQELDAADVILVAVRGDAGRRCATRCCAGT